MNKDIVYIIIPTTEERRPRLNILLESIRKSDHPHCVCIYENKDGGCNWALDRILGGFHGLAFILNDDMTIEPDCISKLYEVYKTHFPNNDGMIQPYDRINKGRVAVSPFAHTDVIKKLLCSEYKHKYMDVEYVDVLKPQGKYLYFPSAVLHHHHEANPENYDETYMIMHNSTDHDKAIYMRRKQERAELSTS